MQLRLGVATAAPGRFLPTAVNPTALAQFATGAVAPGLLLQGSGFSAFVPILLMIGIFFLLVILPARKRQKKLERLLENLAPGDRVVTNGGLLGTVVGLREGHVTLRIAPDGVKLEFARTAVVGMAEKG